MDKYLVIATAEFLDKSINYLIYCGENNGWCTLTRANLSKVKLFDNIDLVAKVFNNLVKDYKNTNVEIVKGEIVRSNKLGLWSKKDYVAISYLGKKFSIKNGVIPKSNLPR